jgi:adenosylcobinamide kinase/adenosylcobinamide-phosphate guanylyltransferase
MTARLVFILGGTRSGKSRHAGVRASALAGGSPVAYLATARPGDPELDRRIAGHRAARPTAWTTTEVGPDLAAAIDSVDPAATILLDGLTLWLSGLGDELPPIDEVLDGPVAASIAAIRRRPGPVVIVSDEIGLGIVPMSAMARDFRDLLGLIHQRIAAEADEVLFMVAGLPMTVRYG